MQPYPRAPDLVWPGHLHGTGCLSARAVGTGFPTVGLRLWLGPGCGWSWVLFTPARFGWGLGWVCLGSVFGVVPLLPAVCGVRGWALVSACFRDLCGFVRFSLAPRLFGFRCAVWACVLGPGLGCAPPFLAGLSGCVFCAFFFFFFSRCWLSLSRALWSLPLSPFFRAGLLAFFFFFLLVSVPLFPVGRCFWLGVAGFGWVVPPCLFGGPVFGALWVGGLAPFCVVGGRFGGCGVFSRAPAPPRFFFFFFFWGGGAYLAVPPFAFPRLAFALCLVCGVVGPSPLLAEVPVCYSPPLLAGFRCRWWWAVPATPGWGLPAAVVCGVWRWCVGGVVAGVWCGWSLATPGGGSCVLLPATPGWVSLPLVVGGPRHSWLGSACGGGVWCVVCGVWCVVCWWGCGWCVVWLVPRHSWRRFLCATPRHSWLGLAAGGGGRSPPLLAGVRLRRWCVVCGVWCVAVVCWWGCGWCVVWLVPRHSWRRFLCATPRHSWLGFAAGGFGRSPPLLAGVRLRRWCVVCGMWRWCVGGVAAGVWCGWSLATPGGGSCVLLPATPGWVSLPLVVGGSRHSWLGSACGVGVWCVAVVCWWGCGWCVVWLVPRHSWRRSLCATPRHSWLGFAAGGGGRSPPLLAGVRWRRWCVVCGVLLGSLATPGGGSCVLLPATPGWVSLPLVVGGPRHSWLGSAGGGGVRALLGRVGRAGLPGAFWCASPFPLAALSFCFAWPPPGWGCPSLFRCCCRSSLAGVCGVWVGCCLAPVRVPWFVACCARSPGLWHPAAVAAWHLSVCLGCGRRRASLACLVAPRGAPRLVRSGRSRCSGRLSRRRGAFPHPGSLRPRLYWAAARGTRRPAENRAHCACRWLPPRQGRWARSASYPFGAPRWGCPWRVPPASVLGCVRCGGWRVWTRSLTRPVSRTVRLSTGDSAGAPGLFCVDAVWTYLPTYLPYHAKPSQPCLGLTRRGERARAQGWRGVQWQCGCVVAVDQTENFNG